MTTPVSPEEYGDGMNDEELAAAGWAVGLDIWPSVKKAYEHFTGDAVLTNSQLWSLREAVRVEMLAELTTFDAGKLKSRKAS